MTQFSSHRETLPFQYQTSIRNVDLKAKVHLCFSCEKHIFDVTSMFFYLYRNTLFPSLINCMKLYYKMDEKCYFTRNNT